MSIGSHATAQTLVCWEGVASRIVFAIASQFRLHSDSSAVVALWGGGGGRK